MYKGKPDRYFTLRFKVGGTEHHEKLGWASEGMNLARARAELARLKAAAATGEGAVTLRERRDEAQRKRELEEAEPTLLQVWEEYAETLKGRGGYAASKSNLKHIRSLLTVKIKDLRTRHLDALRSDLEQHEYSAQTVKHCMSLVRRVIRWGSKNGRCEMPALHVLNFNVPSFDNTVTEFLDEQQIQNLLAALDKYDNQRLAGAMRFALATGMRRAAIFALRWNDISFERKQILLRAESAKNGKVAHIPLTASAEAILVAVKPTRFGMNDFVFGECNAYNRAVKNLTQYAAQYLPEGYRPWHSLRHTFASQIASSGQVDLLTLQRLLTHRDSAATLRYSHLTDAATRRAANIMDNIFRKAANDAAGSEPEPTERRARVTAFRGS
ncbi:MAG: site-specific integrase [Desulfovibrio sp.]|nr:site-specific integrase [Desulfovibrio sp.]